MPVVVDLEVFIATEIGGPGIVGNLGDLNDDSIFDFPDLPPEVLEVGMTTQTVRKRNPIRASPRGLFIGIGVAIYLTLVFPVIVLDSIASTAVKMALVAVGVAVVMMVITMYAIPPKKPKWLHPGVPRTDPPSAADQAASASSGNDGAEQEQSESFSSEGLNDQPATDAGPESGSDADEPGHPG
ncbi:MAG: hypothetical protein V3R84_01800 [Acidimicrobiia bacterium]